MRTLAGEHRHQTSGTLIRYTCMYELKPAGIVFETYGHLGDKRSRIENGVFTWRLRALFPARLLHASAKEAIDTLDFEKFLKALHEE